MAHRQLLHGETGVFKNGDGALHCLCLTADDCLAIAVDVGDDHVAVELGDDFLDFLQRSKHRCHNAGIGNFDFGHCFAAGAYGHQGIFE